MMAPGPISRAPKAVSRLPRSSRALPGTIWKFLPSMKRPSLSAMVPASCAWAGAIVAPTTSAPNRTAMALRDLEATIMGSPLTRAAPVGRGTLQGAGTGIRRATPVSPKSSASLSRRRRPVAGEKLAVEHLARLRLIDMRADHLPERIGDVLVLELALLGARLRQPVIGHRLGEQLGVVAVGRAGQVVEALLGLAVVARERRHRHLHLGLVLQLLDESLVRVGRPLHQPLRPLTAELQHDV